MREAIIIVSEILVALGAYKIGRINAEMKILNWLSKELDDPDITLQASKFISRLVRKL